MEHNPCLNIYTIQASYCMLALCHNAELFLSDLVYQSTSRAREQRASWVLAIAESEQTFLDTP